VPYNNLESRANVAALIPEEVSSAMLTSLSAQSSVLGLGTTIPIARNQTRFPVLSALPSAYFVTGDTGLKQTTEAAWDNKYMYVEEIATIVPIPESVLDDAGFDIWGYLQPLMEAAIARKLDAAVIFGTSAPATWVSEGNLVADAVSAGNVIARGTNAAAAGGIHGDISDLLGTLEADGYTANGSVGNVTLKARLRQVRATTGETIPLPADLPEPTYALPGLWPTGTNAAELVVGDWSNLVVGVRQDMTYKLITEGVITDAGGLVVYNLPQQDMVALRLVFRAAYAVSNPINYQQATEGNRYPFAVLRSPNT
jgi:HK97 family phage major capsid protein